jgi:hypothetical protein
MRRTGGFIPDFRCQNWDKPPVVADLPHFVLLRVAFLPLHVAG